MSKIIIVKKSPRPGVYDLVSAKQIENDDYQAIKDAEEKYTYLCSAWDYSARIGNPANYYFLEREDRAHV